jgi:hypothetical protein
MTIFSQIRAARRRRLAIRDLRALSAETLLDIGIEPDRIGTVVSAVMEKQANRARSGRPHASPFGNANLGGGDWPYPWRRAGGSQPLSAPPR